MKNFRRTERNLGGTSRRAFIAATAATVALGAFHSTAFAQNIDVRIGLSSTSFATSSIRIAEFAGLFEKNGLNASVTIMESGNVAMAALVGGSVDFASSNPAEILALRAAGQPVYIVAGTFRGYAGTLVLSKDDADKLSDKKDASAADKLKALNGFTLAVPSAASAYTWPLTLFGRLHDIKFEYVFIQQNAMAAALQAKTVQGFVSGSPFWEPTIKGGYGAVWISGPHGELPEEVLATSTTGVGVMDSFVKAHPEAVERFRKTLRDVATLIKEEPDRAREALAKSQPKLDPESLAAAFDLYAEAWSHPEYSLEDIQHDIEVINKAQLSNMPDLTKIDPASMLPPQ